MSINESVGGVASSTTSYTYDNNGNMLTSKVGTATTSYTYDLLNQMITSTTADGLLIKYAYNGEGLRVAKTSNGKKVRYLYEGNDVILEEDGDGNQTARSVNGINLISRIIGTNVLYYMYNGHQDVTKLVDATGKIVASYYYDAFGEILESNESVDNPIRYAGYQYDKETGLYYLNARMYDPTIARFLQEDTYTGKIDNVLTLNRYTYCHNSPLMGYDPTGHFFDKIWDGIKKGVKAVCNFIGDLFGGDDDKKSKTKSGTSKSAVTLPISSGTSNPIGVQSILSGKKSIVASLSSKISSIMSGLQEKTKKINIQNRLPFGSDFSSITKINTLKPKKVEKTNQTSIENKSWWNQWDSTQLGGPGNVIGITSTFADKSAKIGQYVIPKAILKEQRPNNIGMGTWNKTVTAEAAETTEQFGKISKVAGHIGYVGIGVDIGYGAYQNYEKRRPTKKIISDAAVDGIVDAGGIGAAALSGAGGGTLICPGIGTAIGAVVGSVAYVVATDVWKPYGKSLRDWAKTGVDKWVTGYEERNMEIYDAAFERA